jgi:dsDNA-specific endonuclease/ATPase MutS2
MNSQKKVNEKLFSKTNKTELSAKKVELGSIKEIKDTISNLKNIEKEATKVADKFENSIKEANKYYQDLLQERNAIYTWVNNQAPARISDFEKAAKELGVDSNSIPEIKELQKLIQLGKELVKALDDYKRPMAT